VDFESFFGEFFNDSVTACAVAHTQTVDDKKTDSIRIQLDKSDNGGLTKARNNSTSW
jgi:hypothetical protein